MPGSWCCDQARLFEFTDMGAGGQAPWAGVYNNVNIGSAPNLQPLWSAHIALVCYADPNRRI